MPSWCFNFSKKDWKKSDLSTCLGATQSASMSAPTNQSVYQEEHIMYHVFVKYTQTCKRKYVMTIKNANNN